MAQTQSISSAMKDTEIEIPVPPRIRVCHLSMTLRTGGLERLLVDFARFHDPARFELSFVALAELGPPADDLRAAGYDVHSIGMPQKKKSRAIQDLRNYLKAGNFDVLHTHNTYPHFYGAMAARWAGISTIINTQHGRGCGTGWKSQWQFRLANRLAARIVGVSEDATKLCQSQDLRSAAKMRCIWNGIDLDRFAYTGPQPAPIAISVARLSPEKDYPTLLRAIRKVVVVHPGFRLKLVGDGSEREKLEQMTRDLKIEKYVEFLGERKDVPELLRTAGFYVSSSKTEGISLTLLEAMAVGLPIVTTSVGGNPEIVVDGVTGKLVPPLNPDALASAILDMIEEHATWPQMAELGRLRVEQNFNIRNMVQNYESLYCECVQRD
ncbi:glycosyltransferase [Planctomicrobium sp. SH661]|uniref:glycosyltransferase n=1 Tax=Planctomicrobium sp. SH661 TaxID=3448124 RepID=UPI003F5C2FD2